MKTKIFIIVLFVLAFVITINAQTAKPKQTVKKTTTQTAPKKKTQTTITAKVIEPDVKIVYDEYYDEFDGEFYEYYSIADKKTGKIIKELPYNTVDDFCEGLALFEKTYNDWGYIDKTGKEVIPPIYQNAKNFHQGLAWVELNNKWGCINKLGKEVIAFKYDSVGDFENGKAIVRLNGKTFFINKIGKEVK